MSDNKTPLQAIQLFANIIKASVKAKPKTKAKRKTKKKTADTGNVKKYLIGKNGLKED
jgi:hypothetical protein